MRRSFFVTNDAMLMARRGRVQRLAKGGAAFAHVGPAIDIPQLVRKCNACARQKVRNSLIERIRRGPCHIAKRISSQNL